MKRLTLAIFLVMLVLMSGNVVKEEMLIFHPMESYTTTAADIFDVESTFFQKTTFMTVIGRGVQFALIELQLCLFVVWLH